MGKAAPHRLFGPALVLVAATGFAFKAILIKILYAEFAIDAETLLDAVDELFVEGDANIGNGEAFAIAHDDHLLPSSGSDDFVSLLVLKAVSYGVGKGTAIPGAITRFNDSYCYFFFLQISFLISSKLMIDGISQ